MFASTYDTNGSTLINKTYVRYYIAYIYDVKAVIGMAYRNDDMASGEFEYYLFEKNLQGDIVAVYTASGTKLVSYTYDAWGNVSSLYHNNGASTAAKYNCFRYRGYFYDEETKLYYLNSRYYDPATGRFLNADIFVNANGDLTGFNMFAYCSNNPVMLNDESGNNASPIILITAITWGASRYYIDNYIIDAAHEFAINPAMLRGVIEAERNLNVNILDLADIPGGLFRIDTSIGYAQVKISTAKMLEEKQYIEPCSTRLKRIEKLSNIKDNIRYAAAYIAYIRDKWKNDFPEIEQRPDIWGSLYCLPDKMPHTNPRSNKFGDYAAMYYYATYHIYN